MEPLAVLARFREVFSALPVRRYDGHEGWDLPCPVQGQHKRGDRRWSARIWFDADRLRFWCGRGCTWSDAVAATGTRKKHWFAGPLTPGVPMMFERQIVDRYPYEDERGQLLFEVIRTDPKGFYQRRPGPGGKGWVYDLREVHVLWDPNGGKWTRVDKARPGAVHLPEVRRVPFQWRDLRAKPSHPVLVVEGEKAAKYLRELGHVAICSPLGAGKWPVEFGGYLVGRRVVVFPDNDEPGLDHAAKVVGSAVLYQAESIRVVRSGVSGYALPEGGDLWDWLMTVGDPVNPLRARDDRFRALKDLVRRQKEFSWYAPPKDPVLAAPAPMPAQVRGRRTPAKKKDVPVDAIVTRA